MVDSFGEGYALERLMGFMTYDFYLSFYIYFLFNFFRNFSFPFVNTSDDIFTAFI